MVAANIEGSYQLVRRELPDGVVQLPPVVKGLGYRNPSRRRSPPPSNLTGQNSRQLEKDLFTDYWEKVA